MLEYYFFNRLLRDKFKFSLVPEINILNDVPSSSLLGGNNEQS